MRSLSRTFLLLGLVTLAALVLPAGPALGQGKQKNADTKDVSFKSFDGVELKGTLYPNAGGKRDAVVLLLHDFDKKKGGSSQKHWPALAKALQSEGYVVLSFDFRGFGESTSVSEKFWKYSHNKLIARSGVKPPETINQKNFRPGYYPYLVNDIAAAKAYLDRLNDQKACNTSSVVVIGAGQGATLGAMWLANESRRKKDRNSGMAIPMAVMLDDEPESKDIAAAIWLSISQKIDTRVVSGPLRNWLIEAGRGKNTRIPMGFVYGGQDSTSDNLANSLVKAIKGNGKDSKVRVSTLALKGTKLAGSELLDPTLKLGTADSIRKYLDKVMDTRGMKEWRQRDVQNKAYYYVLPSRRTVLNKRSGDDAPAVDVSQFLPVGFP